MIHTENFFKVNQGFKRNSTGCENWQGIKKNKGKKGSVYC